MNNKRYFHIVYSYGWGDNGTNGKGTFKSTGPNMPSRKSIKEIAIKTLTEEFNVKGTIQIIVENIIEMTEEDFNNFYNE
jgi:hypothetical protein